ncbi:hypothetical protein WJX72_005638 [[Myrmecia] bisecta]|uniref:Uncharacterized protein n=1 Tax=[Myrmecia] bisecta TaxID=41462 RepID=A0AAW1QRR4_9CHLO
MCAILERVCHRQAEPWDKTRFTHVENNRKVAYCLDALQCLVERAQAYGERGQPVEWGWCRELKSFVFVFEPANRLAVEKPEYGHATYFFDLEEPMLVSAQVQRLVGVLSVRGVTRMALLDDTTLDLAAKLTDEEKAVLEKCGWTSPCGIRSLVNFSGERIYHREPTGTATDHGDKADYREKISRMLARGAAGGRITKQRPA